MNLVALVVLQVLYLAQVNQKMLLPLQLLQTLQVQPILQQLQQPLLQQVLDSYNQRLILLQLLMNQLKHRYLPRYLPLLRYNPNGNFNYSFYPIHMLLLMMLLLFKHPLKDLLIQLIPLLLLFSVLLVLLL